MNASPDVTVQIERYLRVDGALRSSPVEEVFITNADIDHSLGLLLLREGERLRVTTAEGARAALATGLRMDAVLNSFCGVDWMRAEEGWRSLGGLEVRAVPIEGAGAPRYAPETGGLHAVGYLFRDEATRRQAGIFPDVPELTDELLGIFAGCDALFFDGTFWSDDEMARLGISKRTARDMGHVPISGAGGSLSRLAELRLPVCAYLHINNTNPILDPGSEQCREVEAAGLIVARDGMRFEL